MNLQSAKDQSFIAKVEKLIGAEGEVLVRFSYWARAGAKDLMFVNDIRLFISKLEKLPAHTSVIVYGGGQLPIRGQVDDAFVHRAIACIPENSEYVILCLERTVHDYRPYHYWETFDYSAGESHAELIEQLSSYRGQPVAVGLWPPSPEESDQSFEAFIPDEEGVILPGPY